MEHKIVLMVANEPVPEMEDEYNRWYTEEHVPMMFEFKGMKKATRYRRISENKECSAYLAVYEFDDEDDLKDFFRSPEFLAAVKDFDQKWKNGGFKNNWGSSYEVIKTWEK